MWFRKKNRKVKIQHLVQHETKRHVLVKFVMLVSILVIYALFLSWKFGFATGGMLSVLTWSFFVLCTPVADAGFLLDFPLRMLFHIRMVYSEIVIWLSAVLINIFFLWAYPGIYEKSILTELLKTILQTPIPYWSILLLSGIGTFLSIIFGDELLDVISHRDRKKCHKHSLKWQIVTILAILTLTLIAYDFLLDKMDINITL